MNWQPILTTLTHALLSFGSGFFAVYATGGNTQASLAAGLAALGFNQVGLHMQAPFGPITLPKSTGMFLILFLFFFSVQNVEAATFGPTNEACFTPPASPSDPIAGYKMEWGTTTGGPYTNIKDIGLTAATGGKCTTAGQIGVALSALGITIDQTIYLVAVSYDGLGQVSVPSNEVAVPLAVVPPPSPIGLQIQ